jgi:branched-chain amino acid transport system substrate-binding protein
MKSTQVNDFYNTNVKIREDGRVMHEMYLWQVKPVAEAKSKYDFLNQMAKIPPEEAWRPLSDGGCPLVKA